jgi:hypothetical protein
MEVSSIGAGLPLVVVGIAAIAIAGSGVADRAGKSSGRAAGSGASSAGRDASESVCPEALEGVPASRVRDVPQGAANLTVVGPTASKTELFGVRLIVSGQVIGVFAAKLLPGVQLQIERFVDAECRPTMVEAIGGGAPVESLQGGINYRFPSLLGHSYVFNFNYDGVYLFVNFVRT